MVTRLLAVLLIVLLATPVLAADWRVAASHAFSNSAMLVFVTAKEDGSVVRESAYCGASVVSVNTLLTAWHCVDGDARVRGTFAYLWDGRKLKVDAVLAKSYGWDLALLRVAGLRPNGSVEVTDDIAAGDEVMGIGAPGGEMWKANWGRIDRIYQGLHVPCDGVRRPDPVGHKEHQVIEYDRAPYGGFSGGGVWNERGQLVAVHVRGYYWEPYPGYSCSENYRGEYGLAGAGVGGATVKRFLAGEGRD